MSLNREEQVALASFLDGEIETDFFDRPVVPKYPILPAYRPKIAGPLGTDHGKLVQERQTHRYGHIRAERFYEDGYSEFTFITDPNKYKEGIVVNGVYYAPDWNEEDEGPDDAATQESTSSGPYPTTTTDDPNHDQRLHEKHNKKRGKSQSHFDNSNDLNELHPDLIGDFLIVEVDYEWPKLPKYPVDELGPQLELFGGDDNGSGDKDSTNNRKSRGTTDPLAEFLRGFDGD